MWEWSGCVLEGSLSTTVMQLLTSLQVEVTHRPVEIEAVLLGTACRCCKFNLGRIKSCQQLLVGEAWMRRRNYCNVGCCAWENELQLPQPDVAAHGGC